MGERKGGTRRKTRRLMKKNHRRKGKISLTRYFTEFKKDEKVVLKAEPAVQKGIYHLRFYGKTGTIKAKKGNCYEVEIKDGNKKKVIISHPVHLKRL